MQRKTIIAIMSLGIALIACRGFQLPDGGEDNVPDIDADEVTPRSEEPEPEPDPLPDLVISRAHLGMAGFQGGCVEEYGPFVTEVCVRNVGEGDAGRFVLSSEGSGVIVEWEVTELAAGEETCRESGDSLGAVMADAGEDIDEVDEGNNSVIIPVPTPPAICAATPNPQEQPPPPLAPLPTKTLIVCTRFGEDFYARYRVIVTYIDEEPVDRKQVGDLSAFGKRDEVCAGADEIND